MTEENTITYFLVYRYLEPRRGDIIDGNTVIDLNAAIADESDVRQVEAMIADDLGIDSKLLGLINLVRLDT
jgi:c-di-GMP-related signal transduction protein